MIGYMPNIYPDELVYSWLSRCNCHCGYCVVKGTRTICTEFAVKFPEEVKDALQNRYGDIDTFLWLHTMIPYYVQFTDVFTRYVALSRLRRNGKLDIASFMLLNHATIRYMRYCPMCAMEDREKYGECYFRRSHQLWDVSVCIEHSCKLLYTDINISRALLKPPDVLIQNENIIEASNKIQEDYSRYVVTAFKATGVDTTIDYIKNIQQFSNRFTLWHSNLTDYERIAVDLHTFYAGNLYVPDAQLIQTVVNGDRIDTRIILMLQYMIQARKLI